MNIVLRTCLTAALSVGFFHVPLSPTSMSSAALAQNQSSQCINGYRTTHIVRSGDHSGGGVILRCRE
jgi:hypothetical protein